MKVWLIWQVSASDGWVQYVCGTEKKARERFEDTKQELILDWEERYADEIDEYKGNYFETDETLEMPYSMKHINILKRMTFDDMTPGRETVNTKPYWECWEVE